MRRAARRPGAKTIKKNTNSTQNKSETHHAKQYEVTAFLSTDCELSTETCSKNVYSLGPRSSNNKVAVSIGLMSLPQVPLMATVKGLVAGYYWLGSRLITRSCPVMTGVASVPK